ncbi:SIS domain-containing protein [Polycladidibacter hongkongensis]|uniref:SIS domain-containing protein n=1 Tax=Polycladidibacter hongkongensis TaxID=1647556 RepID=UPI00083163F3|nr:SIS domain-containing protein [Pseudovibrio hongkongensis]
MTTTHMRREVEEIPARVAQLLTEGADAITAASDNLKSADPKFLVSIARGSSDHAALYLKYAFELLAGLPVASIGPSVASIYDAPLKLRDAGCIAISQSGASTDIVALAKAARESGAPAIAITNNSQSDLAKTCSSTLDILAGPELSVAATKTYVNSIIAGLATLAEFTGDAALKNALAALPDQLQKAISCDWSALTKPVAEASSLYIIGRGPGFAVAHEAALKFKETSSKHAEAYSSAEVLHGPVSIADQAFPVLALASRDAAEASLMQTMGRIAEQQANVFATSEIEVAGTRLPFIATGHPLTDPLSLVVSFYSFIEGFSRHVGYNPDTPKHLKKVTVTR